MQVTVILTSAESILETVQQVRNNENFLKDITKTITAPDMHGHPLKMFFFVLCTGVVKLDTEEEKKAFKENYAELVTAYKEKNAEAFFNALNKFELDTELIKKYKELLLTILIIIGDTLCDRAEGGDDLTLALYRWLNEKKISWEELFSNHSAGTLALYHRLRNENIENQKKILEKLFLVLNPTFEILEKHKGYDKTTKNALIAEENITYQNLVYNNKLGVLEKMKTLAGHPLTGTVPFQSVSLFDFIKKAKNDDGKIQQFMEDMEKNYIPNLKLISYEHIGNTFNLYSHTIIGIETVIRTAKAFNPESELIKKFFDISLKKRNEEIPTTEELKKIIDEIINPEFSKFAKGEETPSDDKSKCIERITCLRGLTGEEIESNKKFAEKNNLENFNNIFGHLGKAIAINGLNEEYEPMLETYGKAVQLSISAINNSSAIVNYYNLDHNNALAHPEINGNETTIHIFFHEQEKEEQENKFNKLTVPQKKFDRANSESTKLSLPTKETSSSEREDTNNKHYFFQGLKTFATIGVGAASAGLILTGIGELTKQTLMFTAVSGFLLAHAAPPVLIATGCALLVFTIAIAVYCYRNQKKSNQRKTVLSYGAEKSLGVTEKNPVYTPNSLTAN